MPQLALQNLCSGCSACCVACPKQAIKMQEDKAGLLYPAVQQERCVECHQCEKACPVLHPFEPSAVTLCYAAWTKDNMIRQCCSSGGVFHALASSVLENGGAVFGAVLRKDDFSCCHVKAENPDELKPMLGSKYVQSDLGNTFEVCRKELERQKTVLFSGTPCQVTGLLHSLKGHCTENLITVEVICHGVPAPAVWQAYLNEIRHGGQPGTIAEVNFRGKDHGWKHFSMQFVKENNGCSSIHSVFHRHDPYMMAFLRDLSLRPSCYDCAAKSGRSGADFSIADFWGFEDIHPELDDDEGFSAVILHSAKAEKFWKSATDKLNIIPVASEDIFRRNSAYHQSCKLPAHREYFMSHYSDRGISGAMRGPLLIWIIKKIFYKILNIFTEKLTEKCKKQ